MVSITPSVIPVTEAGARFVVNANQTLATVTLRGYYLIPLPDGTDLRIDTADFDIQITPTYYNLGLTGAGGAIMSIDATNTESV